MKKVKVSEATNLQLDWMGAKCESQATPSGMSNAEVLLYRSVATNAWMYPKTRGIAYSTDWAQGGPIIGRERVNIQFCRDLRYRNGLYIHASAHTNMYHGYWRGDHDHPLVAAMRCYVASKLGDEVEVPEELG